MVTVYKEIEIELSDIDTEDLIDELESRHLVPRTYDLIQDLNQIADGISLGQMLTANKLLEDLIYKHTGRIVNL